MRFKVKNTSISFGMHGENKRETISFQITSLGRDQITIADKYVFGGMLPDKDKEAVSGRFNIQKIQKAYIEHHKLNSEKIGYLSFFEAVSDEFGEYSFPNLIIFTVFVQDVLYEDIKNAIFSKLPIASFGCGIDGLDFSWEPDGSHQIWKLKDGEERKFRLPLEDAFVTDFDIRFGSRADDEYWEGDD